MAWHRCWPLGLLLGFGLGIAQWPLRREGALLSGLYSYPEPVHVQPHSTLEPAFVSWLDPAAPDRLTALLARARQRRSLPLVTLEPFEDPAAGAAGALPLDRAVEQGRYDHRLLPLLERLCRPDQPVLLRFAHEMDQRAQYPWAFRDGRQYIRLYRAVWSRAQQPRCRQLQWIWSPAGGGDPRPFWPGGDAVDLIGISVFSAPRWSASGEPSSFAALVERRRWLYRLYAKPMLIAEMGISAAPDAQRRWLLAARRALVRYPELVGWVYFDAPQPRAMPLPGGPLDWSLPPAARALVTAPLPRRSVVCELLDVSSTPAGLRLCPALVPDAAVGAVAGSRPGR